jgi:hypothetical protein
MVGHWTANLDGVSGRTGLGGEWDMDSKNRKKRVYGVGGRI